VDFTELNQNQLLGAAAAAGFFAGCLIVLLFSGSSRKSSRQEDPRNHRIRELEADLRSVTRQLEDAEAALAEKTSEFNMSVETLQDLRVTLTEREARIDVLEVDLKGSVSKTRQLRQELQDRATETVREHVRAEEAETELEVARAGSEAVLSEITRLQEEQKHLTDTVRTLGTDLLPDEELFSNK